jgi:hypothetical protein
VLGKIPQSVRKYRSVWENVGKRGKMSKSKGKYHRNNGENSYKNIAKVAIFPKNGKLSMGKLLLINGNIRKLA